jgi:hypothetical protein
MKRAAGWRFKRTTRASFLPTLIVFPAGGAHRVGRGSRSALAKLLLATLPPRSAEHTSPLGLIE